MKKQITHTMTVVLVLGLLLANFSAANARLTTPLAPDADAQVKVAHFAPFADTLPGTSVTVRVNGADTLTDFQFGEITDSLALPAGEYDIEILPTGSMTAAITGTVSLMADTSYTLAAIGNGSLQPLELFALVNDTQLPASGAKLFIGHLAPFAADLNDTLVDICTDAGAVVLADVPYKGVTDPYLALPAGDYDLQIAAPGGTCSTTLLDLPSVRLVEGEIYEVFAIGDILNQPLQIASPTGLSITPARVSVAHFAPFANTLPGTSVTVQVNGSVALEDFVFGEMTGYLELPAGEHLIEILPSGTSTVAISGTVILDPATDYTLAAIGNGSLQPLELFALVDDNTPPDMMDAKLRVAHLAPFAADLNDTLVDICTDGGAVVLADVPYKGVTDPYVTLPAGDYDLQIAAPGGTCSTTLLDLPSVYLAGGSIADVFAIGDITNQPLQITTGTGLTLSPMVSVAHFAPFADTLPGTSVTVEVDGSAVLTDFEFGDFTGYLELATGDHLIEIFPTGSMTPAITGTVSLMADTYYTLAAIGNGSLQPLELFALVDDTMAPVSGAKLRVGHLAPFAADLNDTLVDICTDDGSVVLADVPYKGVTDPYLALPAGDYDLQIAAPGGTCSTTLLDLPSVRLMEGKIYEVFAIGDILNQPLQIASPTGLDLTPARVNVAHFASFADTLPGTSVTVKVNGATALEDFVFGEMTGYLELPAGEHLIEILPTGTSTVAISGTVTLDPATDYTLAAIGNGSLQPLELFALVDDNLAPASGGKVRVAHLAPFAADLNDTLVDICTDAGDVVLPGVPYKGVTDPYLGLPAGAYDLQVTAAGSNCATTLIDLAPFNLVEGEILSVFAIGDGVNFPPQAIFFPNKPIYKMYLPAISNAVGE